MTPSAAELEILREVVSRPNGVWLAESHFSTTRGIALRNLSEWGLLHHQRIPRYKPAHRGGHIYKITEGGLEKLAP